MESLWFALVAFMITGYVVLDGFDLGAGAIHLLAAKTSEERRQILASIGPFWDGNEVWLLAAGGTLYFAFPALYASAFSGFYLPLIIVLWLLILRGIAIEFRNHLDSPAWTPLWDVVFSFASALLAIFFGAALGNVVRGVPLNKDGEFFLPLWTTWTVTGEVGILDWYTVLVGLLALVTLTMHGALWVTYKTDGALETSSRKLATTAWTVALPLNIAVTVATFSVQPLVSESFRQRPWGAIFPAVAVAAFAGIFIFKKNSLRAFLSSAAHIAGMLASVAFGIFPYLLPATPGNPNSLTIQNSAAGPYGLSVGLMWWIPGMLLATAYALFLYRKFAGKVDSPELPS